MLTLRRLMKLPITFLGNLNFHQVGLEHHTDGQFVYRVTHVDEFPPSLGIFIWRIRPSA
jgi:hypothetical protein